MGLGGARERIMQRNRQIARVAASAVILALAASAASAQTYTSRSTTYFVDLSGGLDGAVTTYANTITVASNVAGGVGSLAFRTGHFNENITTTGDVTTTYAIPAAGVASEDGSISSGPDGGSFQFGYQTQNGPDLNASWTESGVASGHKVLTFSGGGTNLDDVGAPYDLLVAISGNWSTAGTDTGDHTFLGIDPSFTVTQDFVYNAGLNETFFQAHATYDGVDPGLTFNLVGQAVPEPASWAMMLVGFGGLGVAMRSRRKLAAATA
jgi:hypothetical protein